MEVFPLEYFCFHSNTLWKINMEPPKWQFGRWFSFQLQIWWFLGEPAVHLKGNILPSHHFPPTKTPPFSPRFFRLASRPPVWNTPTWPRPRHRQSGTQASRLKQTLQRQGDTKTTCSSWNPKQPFINGSFNWMIPNLYMEHGCFNKHP